MTPLSLAIVCKNNEPTIGRVLESVRGVATEIVAIDSGSTDGTIALLEAAGARVIRAEWRGHVATKQMALEACAHPWVLCLDSDEPVMPDLAASIREAIAKDDPAVSGYRVNRKVWYAGGFLEHTWQPEWRLRLVRRGRAKWGGLDPHDKMEVTDGGKVLDLAGTLRHDSFATIGEHFAKQVGHAKVAAKSLYDAGGRSGVLRMLVSAKMAFLKQYVLKSGWRDGWRGAVCASSAAVGTMMKHAVLMELSRAKSEER